MISLIRVILLPLLLLLFAQPAQAFVSWQGEELSVELRGLVTGSGITLMNPDNALFYNHKNISGVAVSGRLMLDASYKLFSFEVHAEQDYAALKLRTAGARFATLQGVERSDYLDWSFDSKQSHLIVDRLNMQLSTDHLNLKAGRQPLSLAATFYFTPNDFFAPFAAQTFFRAYKPGVDALRADIQLAELSQLTLIAVLGYQTNPVGDNGWSNRAESGRHAYLTRLSTVYADFEFALLAGSVKKDLVLGGDFQGELFEWLGVRGEGHLLWPDSPLQKSRVEVALGLEHRWENSLTIRTEQFYHGAGVTYVDAYNLAVPQSGFYLARHYTAVGASYEFTPLLTGDATTIYNWVDQSALVALYALYSLTDESEIAFSVTASAGKKPQLAVIQSEFGLYGDSASVEYRSYF